MISINPLRLATARFASAMASEAYPHHGRAKCYSRRFRRDLVTRLHFRAHAERISMKHLADRLIEEALARPAVVHEFTARVAEEPPRATVPG
jgi:hypothetical protein